MAQLTQICARADVLTFLGKANTATDAERGLIGMLIPLAEDALRDFVGYSIVQATYTHYLPNTNIFQRSQSEFAEKIGDKVIVGANRGSSIIQLPELPVRSLTSVNEDFSAYADQGSDDFAASTLLTAGTDYYLDIDQSGISRNGHVVRIGTNWSGRRRTVKNTYVAGYTVAELDGDAAAGIRCQSLKFAAILTVVAAFNTSDIQGASDKGAGGALAAESITTSGHSVTYDTMANRLISGMQIKLPPQAQQLAQPFRKYHIL